MVNSTSRIAGSREEILCPVCGKASYSLGGMHPQCAVELADSERKKQLSVENQAAAKRKSKVKSTERMAWNMKKCPKCRAELHLRKRYCACGYDFFASWR